MRCADPSTKVIDTNFFRYAYALKKWYQTIEIAILVCYQYSTKTALITYMTELNAYVVVSEDYCFAIDFILILLYNYGETVEAINYCLMIFIRL